MPYLGQQQNLQFWKCTFSFTKLFLSWFSVDNIFQLLRSYTFSWRNKTIPLICFQLSGVREALNHRKVSSLMDWFLFDACLRECKSFGFFLRHDSMTNLIWASWGMFFVANLKHELKFIQNTRFHTTMAYAINLMIKDSTFSPTKINQTNTGPFCQKFLKKLQ